MSVGVMEKKPVTATGPTHSQPNPQPTQTAPSVPSGFCRLPDDRVLAYDEYGLAAGLPLFYFHDSGSSRLEAKFFHHAARLHGYRLIAMDRPGIGCSDFSTSVTPLDICQDVLALAKHLGIKNFAVMSLAAGGIFGLTMAHYYPERVTLQLNLAGVPGSVFNETSGHSYAASCWNELTPVLIKCLVRIKHRFFPDDPAESIARLQSHLSYTDRKMLSDPTVVRILAQAQREALRQGYRGVAQDMAVCFRKLDFSLEEVVVPTIIWQGSADRLSQRADCEYMVARLPDVRVHRVPNRGHFFFVQKMDQVFRCLREPVRTRAAAIAA